MKLSDHETSLLIQIIFEWDRWITMAGMETEIEDEAMEEIKQLFRHIYYGYWNNKNKRFSV